MANIKLSGLAVAGLISSACMAAPATKLLNVPSPDWRDQIIYFAMIDRFNDGDVTNNDQGADVYHPKQANYYSGGDIKGVIDQLDYIKQLGATALWITPPVANQWWFKEGQYAGYHGYWATDFMAVDAHYGDLASYQALSSELHQQGMYLIQDIVANHTGNFFGYKGQYDPANTIKNFNLFEHDNSAQKAPVQYPFNLIDRTNKVDAKADIYHWTPGISDYKDPIQESSYQLASLADINTSNEQVRKALKQSYRYWIDKVGVDAYRVDTVKYVEHDFWHDFFHAEDGIFAAAKASGRDNFLAFGEVFESSDPLSDSGEVKLASYLGTKDKPELNSVIGFPLFFELNRVFAEGKPVSQLAYRLQKQMEIYPDPWIIPNFVDNHDTQRFLASGSIGAFKQALATIFTIPGIPVVYQGDEQAFTESRQAMFKGGYHSDKDWFDTRSEMFLFIQKLANLRKANPVFSRGDLKIISADSTGPGIIAYQRDYKNNQVVVLQNSADSSRLINKLATGFTAAKQLKVIFSENSQYYSGQHISIDANGAITGKLAAKAIVVLAVVDNDNATVVSETPAEIITIEQNINGKTLTDSVELSGRVSVANTKLQLIRNGNIDRAISFSADQNGRWQTQLLIKDLGHYDNSFTVYAPELNLLSDSQHFSSKITKAVLSARVKEPLNDAHGPDGKYVSPQHKDSKEQRDILAAAVETSGANLQLTLSMAQVSQVWGPANGFDNVSFSVFFDLSALENQQGISPGIAELPLLNSRMPDKGQWHLGHEFYGWGNSIFTSAGASAGSSGQKLAAAPQIKVNHDTNEISVMYRGEALNIDNWRGAKIYITTWDKTGEGRYYSIGQQPSSWTFGGAAPDAARIMDDLAIVVR